MSAVASFILMPKSALDGLRAAATPQRSWLGRPKDRYWDYLKEHGREVSQYEWSGYILATLLPFLEERHQIDLMTSEFDQLSTYLVEKRGATHFVFTEGHKRQYLDKLNPQSFSADVLGKYYNEFNEVDEPDAGRWMLDGIRCFRESLAQVDANTVIVFVIG